MKVLFDLNVILDVIENRPGFVRDSATALGRVVSTRGWTAYVAAHAVTTAFYILRKHLGVEKARMALGRLLKVLTVVPASGEVLVEALGIESDDYEDVVTFVSAAKAKCDILVTRNVADFAKSPVPAMTPEDFLLASQSEACA